MNKIKHIPLVFMFIFGISNLFQIEQIKDLKKEVELQKNIIEIKEKRIEVWENGYNNVINKFKQCINIAKKFKVDQHSCPDPAESYTDIMRAELPRHHVYNIITNNDNRISAFMEIKDKPNAGFLYQRDIGNNTLGLYKTLNGFGFTLGVNY